MALRSWILFVLFLLVFTCHGQHALHDVTPVYISSQISYSSGKKHSTLTYNPILTPSRSKRKSNHINLNDDQLKFATACTTLDQPNKKRDPIKRYKSSSTDIPKVYVMLEIDHASYITHDSDPQKVIDWTNKHFQEVATIYDQEGITLELAQIFIWDSPDIYSGLSMSHRLKVFANRLKDDFGADLAFLMTTQNVGGGLANLDALCTSYDPTTGAGPYAIGASLTALSDTSEFGSFWNTYLMAHEIGHILGSQHTQACAWGPSNDEPIDNCFPSEGDCQSSNAPEAPGTIMSYCYLNARGIDFNNGLGPQPSTLIRNIIQSSACLSQYYNECTVGIACDDGNPCTINDQMNENCQCQGEIIDINDNDICDINELCDSTLYITVLDPSIPFALAQNSITSMAKSSTASNVSFSAGQSITLEAGFEISNGSAFTTHMYGCKVE